MFKNISSISHWVKALIVVISIGFFSNDAFAAGPPKASELSNPLAQVLLVIIVGLLVAIGLLASVILGAAQMYLQRFKEERKRSESSSAAKVVSAILLCFMSTALFAQTAADVAVTAPVETTIAGLGLYSFYALITVIVLELVILIVLLFNLKTLLAKEAAVNASVAVAEEEVPKVNAFGAWWDRVNSLRPLQEEATIDLGHNYDGIRELDNRLPPWWIYGFYLCIIFAVVYLYRYHVVHSAPSSTEELTISMEKAALEQEEYLKKSANKVDENTVAYLTGLADLDAGKKVYDIACVACHLKDGGGSVGPNLTDNYWIHGGSIKDIFKTLKYGWPEKGMKSWKDDYSPVQLAQISSYVKSLQGTKPGTAKEPQGVIFEEKAAGVDSTKAKVDSSKAPSADKKAVAVNSQ